ncbi:ABC transporter ATP-binding protein [Acetobacteraceae bacterium ESL0709]|nr:ABC transporter ATP-binding protein [Acetobacteraceae bacterium ESL0697]MDF7678206.1 ABC transporter ATP-binding protein [Acetobacteraceae bacterium ESL0709]
MADSISTAQFIGPVLELSNARPIFEGEGLSYGRYNLTLNAGECALIQCRDKQQAASFTDLCSGLLPVGEGSVRCLGLDWKELEDRRASALRGHIGRIYQGEEWLALYPMQMNILWARLYHTRRKLDSLVKEAVQLSMRLGLPGLPTQLPSRLSSLDLRRAEYVRAFIGHPALMLMEEPVLDEPQELYNAFLGELTSARERGAAIVWISSNPLSWRDYEQGNMQKFRLSDSGLTTLRGM